MKPCSSPSQGFIPNFKNSSLVNPNLGQKSLKYFSTKSIGNISFPAGTGVCVVNTVFDDAISLATSKETCFSFIVFFIFVSAVIAIFKDAHPEVTFIAQMMGVSWGALAGSFLAPFLYGLYWKGVTKASAFVCFIWGCAAAVIQLVITLGGVDVSGWGPVLGYIFKSSINSGVIAMVGGLILVPVVSLFTKKQAKKVIDDLFACYEEKVMTTRKEALEDE